MDHGFTCPGCRASVRKIYILLRSPRPPFELRTCLICTPKLLEDGWKTAFAIIAARSADGVGVRCWRCRDLTMSYHVLSKTDEPVKLERCDTCARLLRPDGWRAAAVCGLIGA